MAEGIDDLLNPARLTCGKARVAMAGLALSMALTAIDRGWTQTAPPALGLQSLAQQVAPEPQQIELPPAPVERENPG
ncbi:hypothetical protein CI1B_48240 [Bradyrhizobium ivorense]|uniref:Uncharacterized protein n=1 Tax=Bradyrhizobium ivorense TaxID=2511166 RepID=A0A508TEG4_9BRAD|nr:hypothetical protein CI1B_48240 [Bradyrhizobium ivorense]